MLLQDNWGFWFAKVGDTKYSIWFLARGNDKPFNLQDALHELVNFSFAFEYEWMCLLSWVLDFPDSK